MRSASIPGDELARLEALARYGILDTPPEAAFDELARLAALICGTAGALITFVDERRQWFKSRIGFPIAESGRELSFCAHAILEDDVMVVPDAAADPRFADHPMVTGPPQIRCYAAAPLISPGGYRLGTIAVFDAVPRELGDAQRAGLRALGHQVIAQLELRRRAARALEDRESEKGALLASSPDCVVAIDHDGRILEWNPAAEKTFGWRRADVLGRELAEVIVPPSQRARHRRGLAHYRATGHGTVMNQRIETTAVRADGTELPVELTITRLGRADPAVFCGFIRDVTERKAIEAALRQGIERFELLARATRDAVWDWDLVADTRWWNEGFQILFGYSADEIEPGPASWTSRLHPDDVARVEAGIRRVIDHGGRSWSDEYRFRRRDGAYADILDRGHVIRNGEGTPVRMIGAMMDITERTLAQERYRELVEGVREVIVTLSADGAITSLNRAGEEILGWPRDQWIGRPFARLVHEGDRALAASVVERVLRGDKPAGFELRLDTRGGAPVSLEFTVSPRQAQDRVIGVLGVGRDVTERKRLEEQLRQAQKMDAIGQLSGGVAHDFNNLLIVIRCNATLLAGFHDPAKLREHTDEIVQATERAASLTRQLLLASRKQVMQPSLVDLNDVARNMTRMFERIVGEDIALQAELADDVPLLRADAGMLEQVLLNLVVNARDAMPRGGRLAIATSVRTVARARPDTRPGPCVCLTVRDTGCGIAPDVLPHIFEPFFTTKAIGKGTGLGLATVYGIVQQHGGWIEVSSEVGQGTAFSICLPVIAGTRAEVVAPTVAVATQSLTGTETILVVEDEAAVRRVVVNLLERHGYTVLQAASGVAALEIWKRQGDRIDLVLTDLVMPDGVSGLELAERLRGDRSELKVIYSSGYTGELLGQGEPLTEGINFLQKPYHPGKLARMVRERLDRA